MEIVIVWARIAVRSLEAAGTDIIMLAALLATVAAALRLFRGVGGQQVFRIYRRQLGHGILLGLELLVAADIINTVGIEPTFRSVGVLTIIILIRTFLSFALEMETTGRWPWQQESGGREESGFTKQDGE